LPPFRLVHLEDDETVAYAARYDARFAAMRISGAWEQAHPWVEAMLPGPAIAEILRAILEVYPLFLGDGPRLLFVNPRGAPPRLKLPESDEVACTAMLPVAVPAHLVADALDAFTTIHRHIVSRGGKRVLSGWTAMMDQAALDEHFGDSAAERARARGRLDPRGVLNSPLCASGAS
ncbi:MAG TPA: hypothetical protein VHB21_01840, partial [Minicystis sp.]|nr:hypothetical protein [Minicystis sp.]